MYSRTVKNELKAFMLIYLHLFKAEINCVEFMRLKGFFMEQNSSITDDRFPSIISLNKSVCTLKYEYMVPAL